MAEGRIMGTSRAQGSRTNPSRLDTTSRRWRQPGGFTLIELLVVMSIISVLASMLLPSLSRAKERGVMINCVNNLRQIGISVRLYSDDFLDHFPPDEVVDPYDQANKTLPKITDSALGGFDPTRNLKSVYPSAKARPLYGYITPSRVYACTRDKGQMWSAPSNFENIGCSYQYNAGRLSTLNSGGFKVPAEDRIHGIGGKPESWVPTPVRYILLHEPPARLYGGPIGGVPPQWYQWHYNRGRVMFNDPKPAPNLFISPVAFVDGHVAQHNFTKSLANDPYFPYEPTADWIWYKPLQ